MFRLKRDDNSTEYVVIQRFNIEIQRWIDTAFSTNEISSKLTEMSFPDDYRIIRRVETVIEEKQPMLYFDEKIIDFRLDNKRLNLAITEMRVLNLLIKNPGVRSRRFIIEQCWPQGSCITDSNIDVIIHRIKNKIGKDKIETIYGCGYRFNEEGHDE